MHTNHVGMLGIKLASYDARKRKLTIAFASGHTFAFIAVSEVCATLLIQAVDPMAYFDRCIRGHFEWEEIPTRQSQADAMDKPGR